MKFDEKYNVNGATKYVVVLGTRYRVTDDPAKAQRRPMKEAIFNDEEPLMPIGGTEKEQMDIIVKKLFEIVRQDKFDYDKEDVDIRKMFINERVKIRSFLTKTLNRLRHFYWYVQPRFVEEQEFKLLQNAWYEIQSLIIREAAVTIMIRKDMDNEEDLAKDMKARAEKIENVS